MFQSTNTILAGVIGATGLTVLHDIMAGTPSMKPVLGGFVIGALLLTTALVSVPVAAALAFLLLLTSIMVNGAAILAKTGI